VPESYSRVDLVDGKEYSHLSSQLYTWFELNNISPFCSLILICNNRSHSVNLVHIAGQTYLVDVGFGGKFCAQ
jgi:N-acetyltransferase